MKSLLLIISLTTAGCASTTTSDEKTMSASAPVYQPASSAALAFDPPIAMAQPLPSFDRAGRAPEAFVGYEEATTTTAYTHQRDEIRVYSDYGRLERRAYYDRTSITRR